MATVEGLSQRAAASGSQPIGPLMHLALSRPELISLAAGFVDQASLPTELARKAIETVLADPRHGQAALQYGSTPGFLPLRELVRDQLFRADGVAIAGKHISVEQVFVTAGSNELLHLLVDTLCNKDDIVLCAEPAYFVFLGILRSVGVRAIGVATDEKGLIPEALEEELTQLEAAGELDRVKALYLGTYFDNPSTMTLAEERRGAVVEMIKRWSKKGMIRILEDAAYRELRYEGDDLPSLRSYDEEGDTVILTETFSKSFSPGLRVGWGFLPRDLVGPVADQKGNIDFGAPNFAQHVMASVLEMGLWRPHVERLRDHYRQKKDAMLAACDQHFAGFAGVKYARSSGGLYVWLQLPAGIATGPGGKLFDYAVEEGMLYVPGEYFYSGGREAPRTDQIRLSYGYQSIERIERGIAMLAKAVRRVLD